MVNGFKSAGNRDIVFGFGTVGKTSAQVFGIDRVVYKKNDEKVLLKRSESISFESSFIDAISDKLADWIKEARYIWICVPTPPSQDGSCDITAVEDVIETVLHEDGIRGKVFVIRSTVIPGTADKLYDKYNFRKVECSIISFPEFLTERTALSDATNPWLSVIGGNAVTAFLSDHEFTKTELLWVSDNITAEMIKYAVNSLFATLNIFANQIYEACTKSGASYSEVRKSLLHIPWQRHNHLDIYKDGYRGFAGKCLPKDILAFTKEYKLPLLDMVRTINERLMQEQGINPEPKSIDSLANLKGMPK